MSSYKIRGSKTDDDDCELIAKVLKFGVGRETKLPEENLFKLKQLSRFRTDTVSQISKLKLRVMAVLDIVFPEYQTVFFDLFGMTSTKVLSEYTTADVIADMDLEKLTTVLEEASRKRLSRKRAEKLQQTAKDTFGLKYGIDAFSLELKCMIRQVEHLREQKELVEKEIQKLVEQANTKLVTIPGVSFVTAGAVLGELVDFHKKDSSDPRSLLAFAGLDPRHRQSGVSRGTSIMGKRGSPYLRNAIWNAALASLNADQMFRQIYDKQKNLGKHHYVCMSHVAKKLTYVIFSVLKTGRPYYSVPEKTEV